MSNLNGDADDVQIHLRLKGSEAARLSRYKESEKQRTHTAAAYKLMFERLEQWEAERGLEATTVPASV